MSQWITGPICGVDNCRSRLWRSMDGSRVCQYGHVMEGDIEFNNDEDENFVATRRLNLKADSRGFSVVKRAVIQDQHKPTKLYGADAKRLYFRCLQMLLKNQVELVIKMGVYDKTELEDCAKLFWAKRLSFPGSFDTQAGSLHKEQQLPNALDLICIIYLSVLRLGGAPLYICDIMDLLKRNKLLYLKSLHVIPKEMLDKLPSFYLKSLEPYKLPLKNEFYQRLNMIGDRIMDLKVIQIPWNYYYLLLYNVTSKILAFPKPFKLFVMCTTIAQSIKLKVELSFEESIQNNSEIITAAFLIFILKLYLLCSDDINIHDWIHSLNIRDSENVSSYDKRIDIAELITWSDVKIEKYYSWLSDNVIPIESESSQSMMKKRLYNIFKFEDASNVSDSDKSSNSLSPSISSDTSIKQNFDRNTAHVSMDLHDMMNLETILFDRLSGYFGVTQQVMKSAYLHIETKFNDYITSNNE